jgi:hypothetical protein
MRLSRSCFKTTAQVSLVVLSSMLVFGQSDRGTISGTVSDASGAVIPGAKVQVTATATNTVITVTTNASGDYTVPASPSAA